MAVVSNFSIGYIAVGRLPIRDGDPNQAGFIKQGWTGRYEWLGFVPINETPTLIDPPKGYIALANNKYIHQDNKYGLGWNTLPTSRA
jgi:penicillin amidase